MKRITNWLLSGILFGGIAGLGTLGCGEAKEEVEELYNCADICETYEDCVKAIKADAEVDVMQCTLDCENKADTDEEFKVSAQSCQECLDGVDTCKDALPCATECAGVVPEVAL